MVLRPCLSCGKLLPAGPYPCCPKCTTEHDARKGQGRWGGGSTRKWRVQRTRIIERDGACTFIFPDGTRCNETSRLEVHHLHRGPNVNVDDSELATVCFAHNPRGAA